MASVTCSKHTKDFNALPKGDEPSTERTQKNQCKEMNARYRSGAAYVAMRNVINSKKQI